jgi:hypothetical protein
MAADITVIEPFDARFPFFAGRNPGEFTFLGSIFRLLRPALTRWRGISSSFEA